MTTQLSPTGSGSPSPCCCFFYMFIFPPFHQIVLSEIYLLFQHVPFTCFLLLGLQAFFFLWTWTLTMSHWVIHKHQIQADTVWIYSMYLCTAIIWTHRRSITVLPCLVSLALHLLFVLHSHFVLFLFFSSSLSLYEVIGFLLSLIITVIYCAG